LPDSDWYDTPPQGHSTQDRKVPWPEVHERRVGRKHRSTVWRGIKAGIYPSPIQIGPNSVAWLESELDAIDVARAAGKTDAEVRQLVTQLHTARSLQRRVGAMLDNSKRLRGQGRGKNAVGRQKTDICWTTTSNLACKRPAFTFIQIDEQYAIGADSMSWNILKRADYKDSYCWESIASYVTAAQCVSGLADLAGRTYGVQSLSQTLAEAQRITSEFCMALRAHFHVERRTESSGAPGKRARDVLSG